MRFFRQIFIVLACLAVASPVWAQDIPAAVEPNFTAQSLETQIKALEGQTDLSEEQREAAKTALRTAADRLAEATRQSERRAQFAASIENATELRDEVNQELERTRDILAIEPEPMSEPNSEAELFDLEQELIAKQSDLAEVTARLESLDDTLQNLAARQIAAPRELSEARAELNDYQTRLNTLGDTELEAVSDARRTELKARAWYRRNQIRALEQELATLPLRQELLAGRRSVANLEVQILRREERLIAEQTGQKRVKDARDLRSRIAAEAETVAESHPLVAEYAQTNLSLANQLAELAGVPIEDDGEQPVVMSDETAPETSQRTANVRGQLVDVESNLLAAQNLVERGRLDREAGEVLRRLGRQLRSSDSIRADLRISSNAITTATRQQIIAQEDLRALPVGAFAIDVAMETARDDAPALPDLTEEDRAQLNLILETRRTLLQQILTQATTRINDVRELETAQEELLDKTESLQLLLDENLLWVRSVPAINEEFPRKVMMGALELFSVENMRLAISELITQARAYFVVVIGFLVIIFSMARLRPRVREDVNRRAKLVGRVKQDSAWHTPAVIAAGIFNSLPLSLFFLLIALLYISSGNPDRLINGLANGFLYLALFNFVFATWIRWDREKGLFDAHFKLPDNLRRTIAVNLRWFVPVVATTSTLLAVTRDMTEPNIAEGFSVFVFILTGLSMMVFALRVLWMKRRAVSEFVTTNTAVTRFRGPIALIIVGLPFVAISLAAAGYYESADQLLWRMFLSGGVILLAYVTYGAIRRAIVVAQRQIKYRQALEKRETELKARREKEAAEERGDEIPPPPPVDTKEIDVTTMTRQTSKLLQTAVFLGFAALLWLIWSSLFPALSIFDSFELRHFDTGRLDENGDAIIQIVSLWDILQALVILGLTFIAARNLPGFLEIFVLNRLGVDAGTRYAVTTVLGYIIVGTGVIIGFNQFGLQWEQFKWIATGLSVGIGFGLQKIIANFVSGLIILFERPIRIGDYVTIGDQSGTVSRIKIRATTLKDLDNLEILIPNEALISERVTNWTLSSSITRLIVNVGIAYGSDTDAAREIMLDAVKTLPKVLTTPPPNVLFMGFGDSSLDFEIRIFLNSFDDRVPMTHIVHTEVNKALEAAGIPIPFPQRDLNIVSQGVPLEIRTKAPPARKKTGSKKTPPKTSLN